MSCIHVYFYRTECEGETKAREEEESATRGNNTFILYCTMYYHTYYASLYCFQLRMLQLVVHVGNGRHVITLTSTGSVVLYAPSKQCATDDDSRSMRVCTCTFVLYRALVCTVLYFWQVWPYKPSV